jgi:hypothetical protein
MTARDTNPHLYSHRGLSYSNGDADIGKLGKVAGRHVQVLYEMRNQVVDLGIHIPPRAI